MRSICILLGSPQDKHMEITNNRWRDVEWKWPTERLYTTETFWLVQSLRRDHRTIYRTIFLSILVSTNRFSVGSFADRPNLTARRFFNFESQFFGSHLKFLTLFVATRQTKKLGPALARLRVHGPNIVPYMGIHWALFLFVGISLSVQIILNLFYFTIKFKIWRESGANTMMHERFFLNTVN